MSLSILRLGHRIHRDQRLTTHAFLTARALGAKKGFYTGQRDKEMESSVFSAGKKWGGSFSVAFEEKHNNVLKAWKGKVVHLTAYGIPFEKVPEVKKAKNLLVVVGGEKVPPDIYQKADWNLSVGNQPISEVSALGIFLYNLKGFAKFKNPKMRIVPQERGKLVQSQPWATASSAKQPFR